MFFQFLKKKPKIIEVDEDGNVKHSNKKTIWLIYIIIAAVIAFVLSGTGGENDKKPRNEPKFQSFSSDEYTAQLEKGLEEILHKVKGAGRVKARVTVCEYGEKVLASDKKKETLRESEAEKSRQSMTEEQSAIIYGSGAEEKPFVLKEKLPVPSGVLVVAEGADSETVRLEIYEAVKALYGISGHRIKVAQGNFD